MGRKIRIKWPIARFVSFGQAIAILLVAVGVAFWLGLKTVSLPFGSQTGLSDVTDSKKRIRLLEKLNNELKSEATVAKHSAELHRIAVENMKKALHEKDSELLKTARELHFYRTLHLSDGNDRAVRVQAFNLQEGKTANEFIYALILTGMPEKKEKVTGVVGLTVEGKRSGAATKLVLEDVSKVSDDVPLKFSLKYFQEISGRFLLPEDFEPGSVQVTLLLDSSKKNPVMVSYNWDEVFGDTGFQPGLMKE